MSNFSNVLGQIHFVVNINDNLSLSEGLYNILNCDADLTENEDYFRKNTLKKGYDNEASRIISEYLVKHKMTNKKQLDKAVQHMADLVYSNDSFFRSYDTNVISINDELYSVAISYVY